MNEQRDPPLYLHEAIIIRNDLQQVMRLAQTLLPRSATLRHFMSGFHSPTAWRSAESHFRAQEDADPATVTILTDLALMAEALSALLSVTTEREDSRPIGSLKLAKRKRVEH